VTVAAAAFQSTAPSRAANEATPTAGVSPKAFSALSSPPRREVLNAMRALREMPPFDRGRYSHFSPEERDLLRHLDQ
jgi:hypothetical protein